MPRSDSATGPEVLDLRRTPPWRGLSVSTPAGRAPPEAQHQRAEEQQRQPPPQVDVDTERALVDHRIAEESEPREQQPEDGEHHSEGYADVEAHARLLTRR